MKLTNWLLAGVGLLLGLTSVWQMRAAEHDLKVTRLPGDSLPVTVISPAAGSSGRPVVLIAHGFAASRVIMRGFGLTLAHAGYNAVLWDFAGHAANPNPMPSGRQTGKLVEDAEAALAVARAQGLDDSAGLAILGHSMGSGAALSFGQVHPETGATIAISPIPLPVTPELPHNLLLMAGALETSFVRNAQTVLEQAGGVGGDPDAGDARELVVISGVEHVSILFSPPAHHTARGWLDGIFGSQPGARTYTDRRLVWYGLGLLGILILSWSLAALAQGTRPNEVDQPVRSCFWRRFGSLVVGALSATFLLWALGLLGLELSSLLGLLVGGYVLIWFGVAGVIALIILDSRVERIFPRQVLAGLLALASLWIGVGMFGQLVWLQWLLVLQRVILWPLGAVLLLPWFLAVGRASQSSASSSRAAWWLLHSLVLVGAIFLALRLTPELGFLFIVLPLFPTVLGLHALASAPYRQQWPFALSGALFLSWLLLAVFPLN